MSTERRRLQGATSLFAVGQVLLLAILPKCPLCVAAALTAFGLSASSACSLSAWIRPLALPLLAASLVVLACSLRSRRSCCSERA